MHNLNQAPLLLVLSAPSGAGKTTLARRLLGDQQDAVSSISVTTRSPRGQELDGVDYHFVDPKAFQDKIDRDDFIEWAEVHGHFYGSLKSVVDEVTEKRSIAVFDIDVPGGNAIKRKYPDAALVFILPPNLEELERRLRDRRTDSNEVIQRRLLAARSEMEKGVASYDYIILNDDLEGAYQQVHAVVLAERCRRSRINVERLREELALHGSGPA